LQERKLFGGLVNVAYDPCYHQACDTVDNINTQGYSVLAKAAAYALEQLALKDNLRQYLNGN
jgi:hypothetical protein